MSVDVPENMEEVAMKIARYQVHGETITETEVINQAVKDILQAYLDEALEGHYDDVTMLDDGTLVVTDVMGDETGKLQPQGDDWVADFKADADALDERFANAAQQMAGHR